MKSPVVNGLVDVHCHLLPYVDDGAQNMEQALQLLRLQAEQGVETCFLTVHQRAKMFETPQTKVNEQFAALQDAARQLPCAPRLFLGRENHVDAAFLNLIKEGKAQSLGGSPYMLLEFSHSDPEELFIGATALVARKGYIPIVAHIERYEAMHRRENYDYVIIDCAPLGMVVDASVIAPPGVTAHCC